MPKADATIKAKLTQTRKLAWVTKTNINSEGQNKITDPSQEQHNIKTEIVIATVEENHKIYTYQTVKLPIISSRGNKYILIMYVYDYNAILE